MFEISNTNTKITNELLMTAITRSKEDNRINQRLSKYLIIILKNNLSKCNWRDFTYKEDMEQNAMATLSKSVLNFDSSKSNNPFAWITQLIRNSFYKTLQEHY